MENGPATRRRKIQWPGGNCKGSLTPGPSSRELRLGYIFGMLKKVVSVSLTTTRQQFEQGWQTTLGQGLPK
jgi:hypothetical protein